MNDLEAVIAATAVVDEASFGFAVEALRQAETKDHDQITADIRSRIGRLWLSELNKLGFFVVDQAEIDRLKSQAVVEALLKG